MATQWMNRKQSAAYLGVSLATIDRHARSGRLKKYKIGSRPVFKKEDLDALPTQEDGQEHDPALAALAS